MLKSVAFRPISLDSDRMQTKSDDEDEEDEDDEDEIPSHYAFLATPPPRRSPPSSTPRPHLPHNTTSDLMMSNIHTWTAWEKESLDYDDDRARFIHETFCGCGSDEDVDVKVEGEDEVLGGVRSLSALD